MQPNRCAATGSEQPSKKQCISPTSGDPLPKRITMEDVDRTFREMYPNANWRPQQREIIASVLAGKNTLGILPTGGGKTATYMIPAKLSGPVIVISPLKALMEDQTRSLREKGVPAACLHGQIKPADAAQYWRDLRDGVLKVLLLGPEQLGKEVFLWNAQKLQANKPIKLLVCDEFHCIDEWGAQFRPDFQRIRYYLEDVWKSAVFLALTATPSPDSLRDLEQQFGITQSSIFRASLYRRNLKLRCQHFPNKEKLLEQLCYKLHTSVDVTVTYCSSKPKAEELVAEALRRNKQVVHLFHSKVSLERKREVLRQFQEASKDIVVSATTAFGMGIDKPNIRHVLHYDIPRSVEAYVQVW